MKYLALFLVVVFGLQASADAQPRRGDADKREQIKRRIRDLRAYALIDKLQLDPALQQKVFPILDRYDDDTDRLVTRRVEAVRRLTSIGSASPRDIDRAIDEAIAVQKAFRDLEDRRLTELRRVLSARQTAKLLVVLPEFERRIQNRLRKAALGEGRRRDRTAPAAQNPDDDDLELDEPPHAEPPPASPPRPRPGKPANPYQ